MSENPDIPRPPEGSDDLMERLLRSLDRAPTPPSTAPDRQCETCGKPEASEIHGYNEGANGWHQFVSAAPDLDADGLVAAVGVVDRMMTTVRAEYPEHVKTEAEFWDWMTDATSDAITAYLTASPLLSALDEERRRGERLREAAENRHHHCDDDPIECWVEAMQGEYDERGSRLSLLTEALRGSEDARLLTEQRLAAEQQAHERTRAERDRMRETARLKVERLRLADEILGATEATLEARNREVDDLREVVEVAKRLRQTDGKWSDARDDIWDAVFDYACAVISIRNDSLLKCDASHVARLHENLITAVNDYCTACGEMGEQLSTPERTCGCENATLERRNPSTNDRLLLCERHAEIHDQGRGGIVMRNV